MKNIKEFIKTTKGKAITAAVALVLIGGCVGGAVYANNQAKYKATVTETKTTIKKVDKELSDLKGKVEGMYFLNEKKEKTTFLSKEATKENVDKLKAEFDTYNKDVQTIQASIKELRATDAKTLSVKEDKDLEKQVNLLVKQVDLQEKVNALFTKDALSEDKVAKDVVVKKETTMKQLEELEKEIEELSK